MGMDKNFFIWCFLFFVMGWCLFFSVANAQMDGSYPKITRIENQLYQRSYADEDIYQRLNRLELSIYKKTQEDKDLATRVDDIANSLQISDMPGYLVKHIARMERTNFDKTYDKDTPNNRLERLEYHLIGAVQEGNYKDRIYKLKTLTEQQSVAQYLDDNSGLYNSSNSKNYINEPIDRHREVLAPENVNAMQRILFMVAPLLFGLI